MLQLRRAPGTVPPPSPQPVPLQAVFTRLQQPAGSRQTRSRPRSQVQL